MSLRPHSTDAAEAVNAVNHAGRLYKSNQARHLPAGFFFSVLSPKVTEPNVLIYLAFMGALVLAAALVTLGAGLLKKQKTIS